LATGLKIPWGLVFLPDGNALVGERHSRAVFRIAKTGGRTFVGTVAGGATKLMAMAISPTFATDSLIYAHILTASDARVVAMPYSGGVLGTPRVIFSGIPLGTDHPGGGLAFGPDGRLYVTVGDKGSPSLARNNSSLVGKTLRLNRDGSVPADNPWGNAAWTKGHRNVECITFDPSGKLWAVEFGEDKTDELNVLVRGGDYGWPTYEGGDGSGPVKDPFVTWSPTSTCSPAGLAIKGDYAYVGALRGECLWQVKLTTPSQKQKSRYFYQTYRRIRTVALAPDGSIWMTTSNNEPGRPKATTDDRVIRILT
jgi:glucose/arabinose dehydrogenase